MTTEDTSWRRQADALFARALELPAADRSPFLDRACAGDQSLRRKVERLLAADRQAGDFLAAFDDGGETTPAVETGATALLPDGDRVGAYTLRRRLGSGGMATVYLAQRDGDGQQVAIKVLSGTAARGELRARFDRERRFLARLEHPNVARLYDGGTTADGKSFLVMEYVEGEPVDVFCDLHRLSVEERLRLFRKICAAVAFAHQHLLVHRDLKPENILVTAEGEPKLLDFGIAKLLAREQADVRPLTQTGFGPMTPSYASPEQVRGEAVSTASDVYSLGVMLYELLIGRSPYRLRQQSLHEIAWAVCEQEPEPMSAADDLETVAPARRARAGELRRLLKGDLDHIVERAMRKEPRERYASVDRLAEDLERHLENLPVLARRGSFVYRSRKFVRRHRTPLSALAVVAVLVVGFVVALAGQARQLARERDRAERALSFLVDVLKSPDPGRARGQTITVRQVLDERAERVLGETEDQPEVRAAVMDALGQVYLSLGLHDRAEPQLVGALGLRRRHFDASDPVVADSLQHLALLRHEMGDYAAAESLFREALATRRRSLGSDHLAVAESLDGLATTLRWSGQLAGAEPVHLEALEIRRRHLGERHPLVAQSLDSLASLALRLGDYPRAAALYAEAEEIQRATLGQDHPDRAMTLKNLGLTLTIQGDLARAEPIVSEAVAVLRKTLGEEHPWFLQGLLSQAAVVAERGDYARAEALDLEAIGLQRRHLGPRHPDLVVSLYRLGKTRLELGDPEAAEDHLLEARSIARASFSEDSPHLGHLAEGLAAVKLEQGDLEAADGLYRQSLDALTRAVGERHSDLAAPLSGLARVALARGQPAPAEPLLNRRLELLRDALPDGHWRIAEAESELGACLAAIGRWHEAAALLTSSAAELTARFGPEDARAERARRRRDELLAKPLPIPAPRPTG